MEDLGGIEVEGWLILEEKTKIGFAANNRSMSKGWTAIISERVQQFCKTVASNHQGEAIALWRSNHQS